MVRSVYILLSFRPTLQWLQNDFILSESQHLIKFVYDQTAPAVALNCDLTTLKKLVVVSVQTVTRQ